MANGGKRPGAGRKPKPKLPAVTGSKEKFLQIINGLNREARPDDSGELQAFRKIDLSGADASLNLRKWLYDQGHGQSIRTVNHLHDKPIEMNVNLNLGQRLAAARKRALGQ